MSAPSEGNRGRGAIFHTFFEVLTRVKGAETYERLLAQLGEHPVVQAHKYGGIIKGGWYPLDWYRALHEAAWQITRDEQLPYVIGRDSTYDDLTKGFFRFIFPMISGETMIGLSARFFSKYYEQGNMQVKVIAEGHLEASWDGCTGFDRRIWQDVFGGCDGALRAKLAKEVDIKLRNGGRDGFASAKIDARWSR
jgi:hypothetical protein